MKLYKLLFLFFIFLPHFLNAQLQYLNVPLQRSNGSLFANAWAGGLNNPQFSEVDLNGDAIKDLLVFDRTGNVFLPFLNSGIPFNPNFTFAPQYIDQFPSAARLFVLLRDYNCDGIEDLFTYFRDENSGQAGMSVYKGKRNVLGKIEFELAKPLLKYTEIGQSFEYNIYMSNIDLPDINDIDGDGDLDILNFHIGGGYVELFNNTSVENGWGCDSLHFELADNCWGRFYESGVSTSLDLSPSFDSCANWGGWTPLRNNNTSNPRHAGSTLLSLDVNNDGLKELLLGDISFQNLVLAINSGNADTALTLSQISAYPTANPVVITSFPAAFYLDINNDGIKDLIAAPNADDISVNDRVAWLYTNSNSDNQPLFNFQQQDFLVNGMLDVGSTSAAVFVDFNGDGLLDLVVGNYGIFLNASSYRTRLLAFENIGTVSSPEFKLINQDFANLQQYNLRRLTPTFGDLDNDGDLDLIVGLEDGTMLYVANNGSATAPSFSGPVANYFGIDVGQHATPQLIDLDKDGDLDLVIGERNGNTNYCENIGSASAPLFSAAISNQAFGQIDTRIQTISFEGNSAPFIYDNNGSFLLFMGSESGEVWVYDSLNNNTAGAFRRISSDFDEVKVGRQSIISVADINADGLPDLVVGNKRGGLTLFSGTMPTSVRFSTLPDKNEITVWPNPATNFLNIRFDDIQNEDFLMHIYDSFGRLIHSTTFSAITDLIKTEIPEFAAGIYHITLQTNQKLYSKTLIIK